MLFTLTLGQMAIVGFGFFIGGVLTCVLSDCVEVRF